MAEVTIEQVSRKVRDQYNKAFSAFERGNTDYAIDMFFGVLDLEPRLLIARKYLRLAELKKFKGKKSNAMMGALSGLGKIMGIKGAIKKDPAKALHMAEDLMRKDPMNLQYVRLLDDAAVAADMPEVAVQTWDLMREVYPQDMDILIRLGKLYCDVGDPAKGRECLEVVAKIRPKDQEIQKALKDVSALATLKKGNWEKEGSFREKMKDQKEAERLEQQNKAVKSAGDLPGMIADLQEKIKREPGNINFRRTLADLYVKSKDFQNAISTLEEAQRVAESPDPQVDLAISNYRVSLFDQEADQLRAAGDQAGADAKTAERDAYRLAQARECVARYPNDLQFAFVYGELLYERGEINEAIQQFQKAQRHPQRRIRALYYMALCFEQKEQYDIALEQLRKAASELTVMDDTKKDVLYAMGLLYEKTGNKEDAIACYKDIYAVDIGFQDIAQRIEQSYKK